MPADEDQDLRRPRWWIFAGALALVAFVFSLSGSWPITLGFLALCGGFLAFQLRRKPRQAPVHYCRQCGEILDRNARQCRHCGSASWSVRGLS